ncbi:hypothetical protein M413DRAFT_440737, partial [Hebeloma cylindrosporum]
HYATSVPKEGAEYVYKQSEIRSVFIIPSPILHHPVHCSHHRSRWASSAPSSGEPLER